MLRIATCLGLGALGALFSVAACSDSSTTVTPTPDAAPIELDGGDGGQAVTNACPTTEYATLVVVGDSISDVGGGTAAETPFYRTLLVDNDDALYPDWAGFDLSTCWSLSAAQVVKVSLGSSIATIPADNDPSNMRILFNQVKSLPTSLAGPVLVVGTIGGNDAQAALRNVIFGSAEQQQADIDAFVGGFGAAMTELTTDGRFGAGVKVDVLMTNIYDPSGGTGNFQYAPGGGACPGALGLWPSDRETGPLLVKWNTAMGAEAGKFPTVKLLEMAEPFASHAVSTPAAENWFAADCIHPNPAGHHAIREIFWTAMREL